MAKTVKAVINLPEDIFTTLSANGFTEEVISHESRKLLAMKLYKEKILSLDKSTELSGLSKWEFIEFLSKNGIPVVSHDGINLKKEKIAVTSLLRDVKK